MSEKIAGKIFSTPEEAGVTVPAEEELARIRKGFEEFQARVDAVKPEDRKTSVSPKFFDDISGTEYDPNRKP